VSWDGGAGAGGGAAAGGDGLLGLGLGLGTDRSFSSLASSASAVIGQSHGVGLNFPYAQLDEAGRREYRRQAVLRWLQKRKRRNADRGVKYGKRSTLALRRQRVGGRFVKLEGSFVSVTELERRSALAGVKQEPGGGDEDDQEEDDDADEEETEDDDDDADEEGERLPRLKKG
jgi:hypothetical protein